MANRSKARGIEALIDAACEWAEQFDKGIDASQIITWMRTATPVERRLRAAIASLDKGCVPEIAQAIVSEFSKREKNQ